MGLNAHCRVNMSSHAQILPQGAEKQLSKVNVVVGGGCTGQRPILLLLRAKIEIEIELRASQSLSII